MKALVLYDTVFGNTAKVAQVINDQLKSIGESELRDADAFSVSDLNRIDYLIVGSPTRAFTMTPKLKRVLKALPKGKLKGVNCLSFDTRSAIEDVDNKVFTLMAGTFGYAVKKITRVLKRKGCSDAVRSEVFYVKESGGQLMAGELEKAGNWISQNIQ
ncbi:MAG TPA: flavodoxin domain-containing protein [Thermotogota bacterium]|nr:flavodoxin domain-containing protein [Thermotogota bacterium]